MSILKEYYFTCESEKAIKVKKESLRKQILEQYSNGSHEADGYSVKVAESEQIRFGVSTFKQAEPELYNQYCAPVPVTRLIVKPIV